MDSTIVQPMTIRGAVEKPNSSAPKIAATTTSNLKDEKSSFLSENSMRLKIICQIIIVQGFR